MISISDLDLISLDLDLGALQGLHAQPRDGEHGRGGEVPSNLQSLSQMSAG